VNRSPIAAFDKLTRVDLPERTPVLFDTACVLGGSIAGLLAARVLADHARTVLIIERDQVNVDGLPRAGVPQDCQGHGLLPGGLA
jgi:heterodisulfide reductase subunit A-like polyferredoxin